MGLQIKVFAACLLCMACVCVAATAEEKIQPGVNVLKNPGFEDGRRGWALRNWWSRKKTDGSKETNDYEAGVVTENPHSGKYCYRISAKKMLGGDLQFMNSGYVIPLFRPGASVELSFWARGQANTSSLSLLFRKDAAPWTYYFGARIALNEKWTQHKFRVTLPDNIDSEKTTLMIQLRDENTVYLDDIYLSLLPRKEEGQPTAGNAVANGSFEVGRDRWYATFRETAYPRTLFANEQNIKANIESIKVPDAPAGKRVLAFDVFPDCIIALSSAKFPLLYGHETTISFRMKTSRPHVRMKASLCSGDFPNMISEDKVFRSVHSKWKEYTFTVRPRPSTDGRYNLIFGSREPARFLIDDVRVTQADGEESMACVGWENVDDKHTANIFELNEQAKFRLLVDSAKPDSKIVLKRRVRDAWERSIAKDPVIVSTDAKGRGEVIVTVSANRYGGFKDEFFLPSNVTDVPDCEIVYSVPHTLTAPGEVKDSFFGGHVKLSPFNLKVAQKAGFRWLRLHPPMDTKWEYIEQSPGVYTFHLNGLRRAHEMGFKVLGSLQTVPRFYAEVAEGKTHNWYKCYPPKDEAAWKAWEEYVRLSSVVFRPYIQAWEVWNEPDGKFLQVPEGKVREDLYVRLTKLARKALDENGINVPLLGGSITGAQRPFMKGILDRKVGDYIDVLSFHHYGGRPGKIRLNNLKDWRKYTNREGKTMPLWHSEGEPFTSEMIWLKTTGMQKALHPKSTMSEQAGELVISLAFFKGHGVLKHFLYEAYGSPSGRYLNRHSYGNMLTVCGQATPVLAAHAACVHFLEGAAPEGIKQSDVNGAAVTVATFRKDGKAVLVTWADKPVKAEKIPGVDVSRFTCYDVMGNEVVAKDGVMLGGIPLYLLQK